jgi:hypothetical protein
VKRLTFPKDNDQTSINRLYECFKDVDEFRNMNSTDNIIYKTLRSQLLRVNMG